MVLSANTHEKIFANSLFLGEEAVSRPPHGSTLDPLMEVRILQGQLDVGIHGQGSTKRPRVNSRGRSQ
jgi:hypothetical protein